MGFESLLVMPINIAAVRNCALAAFLICEVAMPAVTLLDHRISRAYDELKHARRRGDGAKTMYWSAQVNALLDAKLFEEREADER